MGELYRIEAYPPTQEDFHARLKKKLKRVCDDVQNLLDKEGLAKDPLIEALNDSIAMNRPLEGSVGTDKTIRAWEIKKQAQARGYVAAAGATTKHLKISIEAALGRFDMKTSQRRLT